MNGVDYSKPTTPADYLCGNCGASGIKLWREYQTVSPALRCAVCAAKEQHKNISDIDADGCRSGDFGMRTDTIGWYVPAVPDQEGVGYWGYTSVPDVGINWWKRLPTMQTKPNPKEVQP